MELLISKVQKHSVVCNKCDRKYRDQCTTEKTWTDVAKKLKLNGKYQQ